MLRIKKGATNKSRGYIRITTTTDTIGNLPTEFAYDLGTYLGYQDGVDGDNTTRTYLYSPDTLIKKLQINGNNGILDVEIYRLGLEYVSLGRCQEMKTLKFDRIKDGTLKNMPSLVGGCYKLEYIYGLHDLDTSNLLNMGSAFDFLYNLKEPLDIANWETSKVVYFSKYEGYPFDNVDFIKSWDMSSSLGSLNYFTTNSKIKSVKFTADNNLKIYSSANYGFANSPELEEIDISAVDMSNVKYMDYFLNNCPNIRKANLSSLGAIKSARYAFRLCPNLVILDLSNIDLENADCTGMFDGCDSMTDYPIMNNCSMATKLKVKEAFDNKL